MSSPVVGSAQFAVARVAVALLVVAQFAVAPLSAQEQSRDTARTSPIIVTATRIPLSQGTLPVAVTVITGAELRTRGITTVADALNDLTSAYVAQSGSQGAQTSLFLRGGESKYVKVLIDGVPANDPGGTYDFGSLTTDNVERIEIVRGPASVIYGPDAVTGVVHVITRSGLGPDRVEVDVRSGEAPRDRVNGSAGTPDAMQAWDASGTMTGALTSGSYSIGFARHQSTGLYQLNNHFQNNVVSGRFRFSPAANTDLRLSLRYTDYHFNYPTNSGGTPVDSNAFRTEDRTLLGIEVERVLTSSLRTVLALSSSVNDGGTDDALDRPGGNSFVSQDKTRRRGAELRIHVLPASLAAITFGAQFEQQDQRSQSQGAFGTFTFDSRFAAARRNAGGYTEVLITPNERFTATLGGRVDDNEQFGRFTTGRVGLSWRPLSATRVRATAGSAFREPTFAENYSTGFTTGNPGLNPERTRSADVGVEQDLLAGRAQVIVTGFAQRFRNLIDYTGSTASCGYSYCNVAEAESNGVEAELHARLVGPVSASAGSTVLRTRVLSPGFDTSRAGLYRRGESLIRRPEHKWNAELSYRGASRFSAAARFLAVGQRTDRDFRPFPATPVTLPAYQRIDLGGEYALYVTPSVRSAVTFRVENLQNTGYQNVFNFLAPRRTISLGVRSSF
jgi:vitamin B12 transporter